MKLTKSIFHTSPSDPPPFTGDLASGTKDAFGSLATPCDLVAFHQS